MSEKLAQLKKKGVDVKENVVEIESIDINGNVITCDFAPTLAVGYWYVNSNTFGYFIGDRVVGNCQSFGYDNGSYYAFRSPFGVTISGNTVTVSTGFQASVGKKATVLIK